MVPSSPPSAARRGLQRSIAARLVLTFTAILALFGVALLVVLHAMAQMERAELEDARLDRAKHAGHRVATMLREQYIHQAHTILEWNRTHLDHYQDIAKRTAAAADELVSVARGSEDRELAAEVARLVRRSDDDFMRVTVPTIDRDEHVAARDLHVAMEKVVVDAARKLKALNEHFEAQSDAARALATAERGRVRRIAIGCFGAAILLAAVTGLVTSRSVGHRVSLLRAGAARIGGGDLEQRLVVAGSDELTEVAAALNEMAERLAVHQAELVRSQKLASMGRLAAGVAHEINGPIGIILGYAKVIRKQGLDDEALSAIESEARQCQRIVQALLDTARPETQRADDVDLAQLAREAVERLRGAGALGRRHVVVSVEEPAVAYGDESRLRQVVLNLLTNAVEATKEDGGIVITVSTRDGRALLSITDDGEGLPPEAREHLFEPFYTTKPHGTGLGLAISRAIVEAHRGELRISSGEPRGTRVELQLESTRSEVAA